MNSIPTVNKSLDRLFALATENASEAISRWTSGAVSLRLEELCEVALEEAIPRLGVSEEPVAMVVLSIEGKLSGDIVLVFDERDGRRFCTALTGIEPDFTAPWPELEQSALMETGNILGSAYLNGLTAALSHQFVPSPPSFVLDYGASVLEQVLLPHGMLSDTVFVSATTFQRAEGDCLKGNVFVIPSADLREAMQATIQST